MLWRPRGPLLDGLGDCTKLAGVSRRGPLLDVLVVLAASAALAVVASWPLARSPAEVVLGEKMGLTWSLGVW